jgi:hypothetical protein
VFSGTSFSIHTTFSLVFFTDGCPEISASLNYITIFQLGKAMKRLTCCLSKSKYQNLVQFCGRFVQFDGEL